MRTHTQICTILGNLGHMVTLFMSTKCGSWWCGASSCCWQLPTAIHGMMKSPQLDLSRWS
jgi:hypothetical protein